MLVLRVAERISVVEELVLRAELDGTGDILPRALGFTPNFELSRFAIGNLSQYQPSKRAQE